MYFLLLFTGLVESSLVPHSLSLNLAKLISQIRADVGVEDWVSLEKNSHAVNKNGSLEKKNILELLKM